MGHVQPQSRAVAVVETIVSAVRGCPPSLGIMTRTWLITGSSAGFGQALAYAALRAGDNVVATARQADTLTPLVDTAPGRTLAVTLDVTDEQQIDAAVTAADERFGRVDVLVNNAGLAWSARSRNSRVRRCAS